MLRKTLASAVTICSLPRYLLTKLPPASGVDLVRAAVSSRYCVAIPMLLSSCASAGRRRLGDIMGRKVHPIGMRLGINQGWQGRWFAEGSQYRDQLHQDFDIRSLLMGVDSKGGAAKSTDVRKLRKDLPDTVKNGKAGVSRVEVARYPGKVRVAIH